MKKAELVFKSLGISEDEVKNLLSEANEGDNIEELVAPIIEGYKARQKEVLLNDPEFLKPIQDKITGKERGTLENKLKKVLAESGMNSEEIKSLQGIDEYIEKFKELSKSKSKGSEQLEEILKEKTTLADRIKEYEEVILPGEKKKFEDQLNDFYVNEQLRNMASKYDLIIPQDTALDLLKLKLGSYKLSVNEKKELDLLTSEGAKVLDEKKEKIIGVSDIIKNVFETSNLIKKNNGAAMPLV